MSGYSPIRDFVLHFEKAMSQGILSSSKKVFGRIRKGASSHLFLPGQRRQIHCLPSGLILLCPIWIRSQSVNSTLPSTIAIESLWDMADSAGNRKSIFPRKTFFLTLLVGLNFEESALPGIAPPIPTSRRLVRDLFRI